MDGKIDKPLLLWVIPTYLKEHPKFPTQRKTYYLDWDELDKKIIDEVLSIINWQAETNQSSSSLPVFGKPIAFTIATTASSCEHRGILKYRKYFKACQDDYINRVHPSRFKAVSSFSIPDYCEDELGNPVTHIDMIKIATGNPNPIILGDLKSILKVGLSPMKTPDRWTQKQSDVIAHFLQVAGAISTSSWMKYKPKTVYREGKMQECHLPDIEAVVFVLVYFRQLVEEDLFRQSINYYRRYVDSKVKIMWVEWERDRFTEVLDDKPMQVSIQSMGLTNRQLLDAFLYGALIAHTEAKVKDKKNIAFYEALYKLDRREEAIWALWMCLNHLAWNISNTASLIYSDFANWLSSEHIPKPNIYWQKNMFTWEERQNK